MRPITQALIDEFRTELEIIHRSCPDESRLVVLSQYSRMRHAIWNALETVYGYDEGELFFSELRMGK